MPELVMERPKMSLQMHETLKRYILRERRKKKEEDVANEQKRREELQKAEIKTQTLETNKEQLKQLEVKLEELQLKKRDLFNQLKKVLNEETNLKKSNRPTLPQSQSSLVQGDQSNPLSMLMYSAHPGHPQMLAPQQHQHQHHPPPQLIVQPPSTTNQPQPSSILAPAAQSQQPNATNQTAQSKPQSPFLHPPQHLLQSHHNSANFLKYLQNPTLSISPQLIQTQSSLPHPPSTINQNLLNPSSLGSPSSSPHLITSSPRHHLQPTIKRQRSPSPPSSPLHTQNLLHNQFILNQNQLVYQPPISPAHVIPSSSASPPALAQSFNSPSTGSKKVRQSNNSNISQSQRQASSQQQQQQQSAFSSYLNSRPNIPGFQSPSQNKSSSLPQQQFLQSQTPPGNASFNIGRNLGQVAQYSQLSQHYLNSLSQEQAKMIFQQQQQQQQFMHQQQQHYPNMSSIPMISAAAAAAVAAATVNVHQNQSQSNGPSNSSSASGSGGGGSILTGFSVRSNNASSSSSSNSQSHQQF